MLESFICFYKGRGSQDWVCGDGMGVCVDVWRDGEGEGGKEGWGGLGGQEGRTVL